MSPIRVVLLDMPKMLRDIVRDAVSSQPDIDIVGDVSGDAQEVRTRLVAGADVLLAGGGTRLSDGGTRFLRARRHRKVIAMSVDGRQACLYRRETEGVPIPELSPAALLAAIRS